MVTVGQIILMSRDLHIDNSTQCYPATDLFIEGNSSIFPLLAIDALDLMMLILIYMKVLHLLSC